MRKLGSAQRDTIRFLAMVPWQAFTAQGYKTCVRLAELGLVETAPGCRYGQGWRLTEAGRAWAVANGITLIRQAKPRYRLVAGTWTEVPS